MKLSTAYSWLYLVEEMLMMFIFKLKTSRMVQYRTCFRNKLQGLSIYKGLRSDDENYACSLDAVSFIWTVRPHRIIA